MSTVKKEKLAKRKLVAEVGELAHGLEDLDRFLRGRGRVEVGQGLVPDHALQDREVGADGLDVEFAGSLHGLLLPVD